MKPALNNQGIDAIELIKELETTCQSNGGESEINGEIKSSLQTIANLLRVHWLSDALDNPAKIICPKSSNCQREENCQPLSKNYKFNEMETLKENILLLNKAKLI